jgi:DNA-binding transcriptional MerR regulator
MKRLVSISELSKSLNLVDNKTNKPLNYILRFWEKEFKEIKPKKINKRRYYTQQQVELIKMIKFLLKNEGITISGVKKILSKNVNKLDDSDKHSLRTQYYKRHVKIKTKSILEKLNRLKSYGKKNSS